MAGDVVEELFRARQRVVVDARTERVDPVTSGLRREQALECRPSRRCRVLGHERAQERHADAAPIVLAGMGALDTVAGPVLAGVDLALVVLSRVPPLVDVARLIDEEVVADVAPAANHGVEVVRGADGRGGVRVAIAPGRVVDDQSLYRPELEPLDGLAEPVEAQRLVGTPLLAGDDRGWATPPVGAADIGTAMDRRATVARRDPMIATVQGDQRQAGRRRSLMTRTAIAPSATITSL